MQSIFNRNTADFHGAGYFLQNTGISLGHIHTGVLEQDSDQFNVVMVVHIHVCSESFAKTVGAYPIKTKIRAYCFQMLQCFTLYYREILLYRNITNFIRKNLHRIFIHTFLYFLNDSFCLFITNFLILMRGVTTSFIPYTSFLKIYHFNSLSFIHLKMIDIYKNV